MSATLGGFGRVFGKLTIGKKLYGLAGVLLVFVVVLGVTSITSLGSVNTAGQSMYRNSALPGLELGKISTATVDAHRSLLRTLLYWSDKTIYAQEKVSRAKDDVTVTSQLAALRKARLSAAERKDLTAYSGIWAHYRQLRDTALRQATAGHMKASLKTTIARMCLGSPSACRSS